MLPSHSTTRLTAFGAEFAFTVLANEVTALDSVRAVRVRLLQAFCTISGGSRDAQVLESNVFVL